MALLIIYLCIFLGIGLYDYFRINSFDDFVVAGRKQSESFVIMSLLATIIGASATLGVVDMAYKVGFPAFWWLGVGAIGLILQSFLLSERVRAFEGYTLPDIAQKVGGNSARWITAFIIGISWLGIVAAQFVAFSQIISLITGNTNTTLLLVITSLAIVVYTIIGGQISILKTDSIQFSLLAIGLLYVFFGLFMGKPIVNFMDIFSKIELLNENFRWLDLIYFLFIVGGAFFIGPDVFSRNFTAKDGKTAKNAALKAGIALFFFSALITLIGMWGREYILEASNSNVLVYLISTHLSKIAGMVLSLGLLSAIISSADTCIITTAAIIENDILKQKSLNNTRILAGLIGIIALIIAVFKKNIISLLMYAYSIFVPGIVCPLFIAIWFYKKRKINKVWWLLAVFMGGSIGLISNIINIKYLALLGMGISLVLSIMSVLSSNKEEIMVKDSKSTELYQVS